MDDHEAIAAALIRLHKAGWTIGDTAYKNSANELVWVVSGRNGENVIRAVGATAVGAWSRALEQAAAVGMLDGIRPSKPIRRPHSNKGVVPVQRRPPKSSLQRDLHGPSTLEPSTVKTCRHLSTLQQRLRPDQTPVLITYCGLKRGNPEAALRMAREAKHILGQDCRPTAECHYHPQGLFEHCRQYLAF